MVWLVCRYVAQGTTYIKVGTLQHAVNGELRGQINENNLVGGFPPAVLPPEELPAGLR